MTDHVTATSSEFFEILLRLFQTDAVHILRAAGVLIGFGVIFPVTNLTDLVDAAGLAIVRQVTTTRTWIAPFPPVASMYIQTDYP